MNAIPITPRSNDILFNLPDDERSRLDQWLLEGKLLTEISDQLAKPPPDGCSLTVSTATISRYRKRRILALQLAEVNDDAAQLPDPYASLRNLLQQSALTTALDVELPPATFQILTRYYRVLRDERFKQRLTEQRDLQIQLARDRYQLDTFKAQYNAAREALDHAAELMAIRANDSLDDPAKIELSRVHLFGANCIPAPAPSKLLPPKTA